MKTLRPLLTMFRSMRTADRCGAGRGGSGNQAAPVQLSFLISSCASDASGIAQVTPQSPGLAGCLCPARYTAGARFTFDRSGHLTEPGRAPQRSARRSDAGRRVAVGALFWADWRRAFPIGIAAIVLQAVIVAIAKGVSHL